MGGALCRPSSPGPGVRLRLEPGVEEEGSGLVVSIVLVNEMGTFKAD